MAAADIGAWLDKKLEEYVQKIQVAANKALDEALKDFAPYAESEITNLFKEVIDDFYNDFSPAYYHRSNSMYNIMKVNIHDKKIRIEMSGDALQYRNGSGGEMLYQTAFKQGFHGGAPGGPGHPSDGTPYYRTPYPHFIHWGRPASISPSPFEQFKTKYKTEVEPELNTILSELVISGLKKYIK